MESFRILDPQISSSSVYTPGNFPPQNARLKNEHSRRCWIASKSDSTPWMQVDFMWITVVTEIQTQGYNKWWITKYKVSYGGNGVDFQFYTENGVDKVKIGLALIKVSDIKIYSDLTSLNDDRFCDHIFTNMRDVIPAKYSSLIKCLGVLQAVWLRYIL